MTKQLKMDRRGVIRGGGALVAASMLPWRWRPARRRAAATKLHILGSRAGPSVGSGRYQTSYAVTVGDALYVVDCGYGATEQLVRAGLRPQDMRDLFITHHHPDHNIELGTLIYFAWYAGMEKPLGIYGPPPIEAMTEVLPRGDQARHRHLARRYRPRPARPDQRHRAEQAAGGDGRRHGQGPLHAGQSPAGGARARLSLRHARPFDCVFRRHHADAKPGRTGARRRRAGARGDLHQGRRHREHHLNGDARVDSSEAGSAIAGNAQKLLDHVINSHTKAEDAGRIAAEAGGQDTGARAHRLAGARM